MYIPCMVHASLAHKVPFYLAGKGCFEAINNLAHLKCFCGHALFEANYRRFVNFNPICTFNRTIVEWQCYCIFKYLIFYNVDIMYVPSLMWDTPFLVYSSLTQ